VIQWWKTATVENHSYLVPDENVPPKGSADYSLSLSDDLLEDIRLCQQIVEKNGMEMLVLDQTRPDIGLKVVRLLFRVCATGGNV
jgi:ribosomal protein S12 methylthiotransferase accessory factor